VTVKIKVAILQQAVIFCRNHESKMFTNIEILVDIYKLLHSRCILST